MYQERRCCVRDAVPGFESDDEILAEIRTLLRAGDPIPDDLIALAKGAFAWRDIDTELARLTALDDDR